MSRDCRGISCAVQSKVQVDAFLVSLVAFALGFGVLALDRKLMRPDGPILLEFIRQTLDAQDIGLVSWPQ